jgi:hypothetical protein
MVGFLLRIRPNFHSQDLVVSGNPRNTVGVACPDAIVVLNL